MGVTPTARFQTLAPVREQVVVVVVVAPTALLGRGAWGIQR